MIFDFFFNFVVDVVFIILNDLWLVSVIFLKRSNLWRVSNVIVYLGEVFGLYVFIVYVLVFLFLVVLFNILGIFS